MGADTHVAAGGGSGTSGVSLFHMLLQQMAHQPSAVTLVTGSVTCVSSDPVRAFLCQPDVDSQRLNFKCNCNICVTHMDGNICEETGDNWSH